MDQITGDKIVSEAITRSNDVVKTFDGRHTVHVNGKPVENIAGTVIHYKNDESGTRVEVGLSPDLMGKFDLDHCITCSRVMEKLRRQIQICQACLGNDTRKDDDKEASKEKADGAGEVRQRGDEGSAGGQRIKVI
jgi:hypothetical protein